MTNNIDLRQLDEIKALKARQRTFVLEYLSTGNGTQSAIKAGYSKPSANITASKLLTNSNIKSALDACYKVIEGDNNYTPEKIKSFWISIMEDKSNKVDSRIRASELLAKANQLFHDNVTNIALFSDVNSKQMIDTFNDVRHKLVNIDVTPGSTPTDSTIDNTTENSPAVEVEESPIGGCI